VIGVPLITCGGSVENNDQIRESVEGSL